MEMKILVTGGTGTVGSRVVSGLLARGASVRVLTRSPHKLARLDGLVEVAEGGLLDSAALGGAMRGVDALFLLTPLAQDETAQGLNAVAAARGAGVRRIVFQTVHRLEEAAHIPHFGSKIPVKRAILNSGLDYSFIEPNNFFQNDLWLQDPIRLFGVYPQPLGAKGLHRVDAEDVAGAAVNALLDEGHSGQSYPLVGPDLLTGEDCAGIWSRRLGREVQYVGDDLDNWEKQAELLMPPWLAHDLRVMYEHFQASGLIATDEEQAACRRILGRLPRRFDEFVDATVASWTAGGEAR
jgi:uncharacterized protein YbjT (DUF2867 family)